MSFVSRTDIKIIVLSVLFFILISITFCFFIKKQDAYYSLQMETIEQLGSHEAVLVDVFDAFETFENKLNYLSNNVVSSKKEVAKYIVEINDLIIDLNKKNASEVLKIANPVSDEFKALLKYNKSTIKKLDNLKAIYAHDIGTGNITDDVVISNTTIVMSLYENANKFDRKIKEFRNNIDGYIASIEENINSDDQDGDHDSLKEKTAKLGIATSIYIVNVEKIIKLNEIFISEMDDIKSKSNNDLKEKQSFKPIENHSLLIFIIFLYIVVFVVSLRYVFGKDVVIVDSVPMNSHDDLPYNSGRSEPMVTTPVSIDKAVEVPASAISKNTPKVRKLCDQFENDFIEVMEKLQGSVVMMTSTISGLKEKAADSSMMCDSVAMSANTSYETMDSTAAAITEMGASIQEVSSQVANAEMITSEAVIKVDQANSTILGLDESAKEIGSIVQLIKDIAKQTNLLSLNAMIEANRAGEAGRGFTVVANEVKALSLQTAEATEKITSQVETMQDNVTGAVDAVSAIREVMIKMDEISAAVAGAVEQQSSTVNEISANSNMAASEAREIAEDIKSISEASKNTQDDATKLVDGTGELRSEISVMEDKIDVFVDEIRNIKG